MGPAQTIEQRQLSKVIPLQDPLLAAGHDHRINPKTGRRRSCPICRLEKRRLKQEREGRWLSHAVELSKEVIREGTRSVGQVGSAIARAHGHAIHGWLSNPDPLTWVGGAAATAAYLTWLTIILGETAKKLGLGELIDLLPRTTEDPVKALQDKIAEKNASGPGGSRTPPPAEPPPPNVETTVHIYYSLEKFPFGLPPTELFFTNKSDAELAFNFGLVIPFSGLALHEIRDTVDSSGTVISTSRTLIKKWPP